METLRRMDFILDLGFSDSKCTKLLLQLMGLSSGDEFGHQNAAGETYKDAFDSRNYELMNALDIRLYQYANMLIKLDCIFFERILSRNPSLLLPVNRTG